MNPTQVCAVLIAKMALRDGVLDPTEQEFLTEMCEVLVDDTVDHIISLAESSGLDVLIPQVEKYEDRFFIAVRAYMMAHADDHYDESERAFFDELVEALEITASDRALIEGLAADEQRAEAFEPSPRLLSLYESSSFYREEA